MGGHLLPADVAASVLRNEMDCSSTYFRTMNSRVWNSPSACEGWSQADVLHHLVETTYPAVVARLKATLRGEPVPDPEKPSDSLPGFTRIQRWLADGQERDIPKAFEEMALQAKDVLAQVEPRHGRLSAWHRRPRYVSNVQEMLHARLLEVSLHTWDVASRHGPAPLTSESLPALVTWIYHAVWRFLATEHLPTAASGTIRIETDDFPFQCMVRLTPVGSERIGIGETDAVVRAPAETIVLMLTGRCSLSSAQEHGIVQMTGREDVLATFEQALRPFAAAVSGR